MAVSKRENEGCEGTGPFTDPSPAVRRGATSETAVHRTLKRAAGEWALDNRFPVLGFEVRVPASPYRADVVAASRHPTDEGGVVALFECKQARSDFLRDEADEPTLRRETADYADRLRTLSALVAGHRPDLRKGVALFPEYDDYDLRGLRHDGLERLQRDLEIMQRKLVRSVKFARLHRYHAADYLYLVTTEGLIEPHEVPVGWGWLEVATQDGRLTLRQPPQRHVTATALRLAWLESMAMAGGRSQLRGLPPIPGRSPGAMTGGGP
jgi:hypothetical protein